MPDRHRDIARIAGTFGPGAGAATHWRWLGHGVTEICADDDGMGYFDPGPDRAGSASARDCLKLRQKATAHG
jgi:hypothetical protein